MTTKQLIVLCDGTSNSIEANQGNPTNIQVLKEMFALNSTPIKEDHAHEGWEIDIYPDKYVYYDRGLGSPKLDKHGKLLNWSWKPTSFFKNTQYIYNKFKEQNEQLTACGIIDNVAQAYYFLVKHYEPGYKIFLFGFSRGAYTLKLLETMIRYIGLVDKHKFNNDKELLNTIEYGFSLYDINKHPNINSEALHFRNFYSCNKIIHFLGLWDNVRGLIKEKVHNDSRLSSAVNISRHALSIDEQRSIFKPEIWIAKPESNSKQMWFAGVHCDVGGGYSDRGLANVSLHWMITEAINNGLYLDSKVLENYLADPLAMQHDSLNTKIQENLSITWKNVCGIYRRPIAQTSESEYIHNSVFLRINKKIKKNEIEIIYSPSNLIHTLIAWKNYENHEKDVTNLIVKESDDLSDV